MRTKVLLGAAALAAGLASSAVAQSNVYSLNVVGYYNIPVYANQLIMIANQLNTTNNTLVGLIPNGPPSATFFKYTGGFNSYNYDPFDLAWEQNGSPANTTLNPGEGGFYSSPTATTLTFVGEVLQGSLTNTLVANGLGIRSSIVPQTGGITTVLGLPAGPSDVLFLYSQLPSNNGYTSYSYDPFDLAWELNGSPNEPAPLVGQAFFYQSAAGNQTKWIRNFTVQ